MSGIDKAHIPDDREWLSDVYEERAAYLSDQELRWALQHAEEIERRALRLQEITTDDADLPDWYPDTGFDSYLGSLLYAIDMLVEDLQHEQTLRESGVSGVDFDPEKHE
jgi:hypothetical protein